METPDKASPAAKGHLPPLSLRRTLAECQSAWYSFHWRPADLAGCVLGEPVRIPGAGARAAVLRGCLQ